MRQYTRAPNSIQTLWQVDRNDIPFVLPQGLHVIISGSSNKLFVEPGLVLEHFIDSNFNPMPAGNDKDLPIIIWMWIWEHLYIYAQKLYVYVMIFIVSVTCACAETLHNVTTNTMLCCSNIVSNYIP